MAKKDELREIRKNTVINDTSKREDKQCQKVISEIVPMLEEQFNVTLEWQKKILLTDIISYLRDSFPEVEFANPEKNTSFMTPDGGITFIVDKKGNRYPILIAEVKNQGTNDLRAREGKKKQAQGNAVERLGKNVIGFRTYMLTESIFPFVCFGDGCDFEEGSSILDRVLTIAMFGKMNEDHTSNMGPNGIFNRGSYYFRSDYWTAGEMKTILYDVAKRSIFYYFAKYGEPQFTNKYFTLTDNDDEVLEVAEQTFEMNKK